MGCLPGGIQHQMYAEVLGPWAKDKLIRVSEAEKLLRHSATYTGSDGQHRYESVRQLVKEGHLEGYAGGRTTTAAMREYHRKHLNPDGTLIECCPHPDYAKSKSGKKWWMKKGAGIGRVVQGCTTCGGSVIVKTATAKAALTLAPAPAPALTPTPVRTPPKSKPVLAPKSVVLKSIPMPTAKPVPAPRDMADDLTKTVAELTKMVTELTSKITELSDSNKNLKSRVAYLEERELASRQRA